jgi:hypothetical protein
MSPTRATLAIGISLAFSLAGPSRLAAQDDPKPTQGKVDAVEREADRASGDEGGGGGSFFLLDMAVDVIDFFGRSPRGFGQGYQRHPWAGAESEPFVLRAVDHGRRFHTLSVTAFADAGSTARGGVFAFQTTKSKAQIDIEYTRLVEPLAGETDRLYLFRAAIGVVAPVRQAGFLRIGGGLRGLVTDAGQGAAGPELEVAAQLFPARPLGVSVAMRGALMGWSAGSSFYLLENVTTGSVFLGPLEVLGGWRWTKIQHAPAFGGPTLGVRAWF